MTLARLLLIALLLSSLPAFTQDQLATAAPLSNDARPSTENMPWKIIPDPPSNFDSPDHIRIDQFRFDNSPKNTRTLLMDSNGSLDTDATCYTMRSYVVARDSKDSDSTHPTNYSTCRPASKYRVRTTQQDSTVRDR
jgi:hypothetical protein